MSAVDSSHCSMILDQINWNLWKWESFQSTKKWSKTTVQTKARCQRRSEGTILSKKQTIYIKNISAKRKTGNNKSIQLTKRFILQIARKILSIESLHYREASQLISIANNLTGFQVMRAATEGIYAGNRTN